MKEHAVYPSSLGPAIVSPLLTWAVLACIISAEIAAGLACLGGASRMWRARRAAAGSFHAAKTLTMIGCGIGVTIWMGLFFVIGGAYFQMWQTQVGLVSFNGSFQYFMTYLVVLLFVHMRDD